MQFTFDSVDEIRAFVKDHLKGTPRRGGKGDDGDENSTTAAAPAPIMPPTTTHQGFAGPPAGFGSASGFPSHVPTVAPEVTALVQRINTKIDGAVASGQPAGPMLDWFRQHCGAEAANATIDQIKTVFLSKLSVPQLENIIKLMGG